MTESLKIKFICKQHRTISHIIKFKKNTENGKNIFRRTQKRIGKRYALTKKNVEVNQKSIINTLKHIRNQGLKNWSSHVKQQEQLKCRDKINYYTASIKRQR